MSKTKNLVGRIDGLRAILKEPISAAVLPGNQRVESSASEGFGFNTPEEFMNSLASVGAEEQLANVESARVEDGVLHLNVPANDKG